MNSALYPKRLCRGRRARQNMRILSILALFLTGCSKSTSAPAASTSAPIVSDDSWTVVKAVAATPWRNEQGKWRREEATFDIRHRNSVAHVRCATTGFSNTPESVLGPQNGAGWFPCSSFPDPPLPVGEPLIMHRSDKWIIYCDLEGKPGMEHVASCCWTFEVLSERMVGN